VNSVVDAERVEPVVTEVAAAVADEDHNLLAVHEDHFEVAPLVVEGLVERKALLAKEVVIEVLVLEVAAAEGAKVVVLIEVVILIPEAERHTGLRAAGHRSGGQNTQHGQSLQSLHVFLHCVWVVGPRLTTTAETPMVCYANHSRFW